MSETKIRVITTANQKKGKLPLGAMKTQSKPTKLAEARETRAQSFAFDWLNEWRDVFGPITERSKGNPVKLRITFDNQSKNALHRSNEFRLYRFAQTENGFTNNFFERTK